MKCKKCGFKARDIAGLAKHYRKAHPGAMKAKGPRRLRAPRATGYEYGNPKTYKFCPHCGGAL